MTTARNVALSGITSPVDPTSVATEGFISGGARVAVVIAIAATSSVSMLVTPELLEPVVVGIAASSSMDVPVVLAGDLVPVAVTIDARSSMDVSVVARSGPRRKVPRGGGGWPGQLYPEIEQAARAFSIHSFEPSADLYREPEDELVAQPRVLEQAPAWPAAARWTEGGRVPQERAEQATPAAKVVADLDVELEEAHRRKAEKLRQMQEEEMEIESLREQMAEVRQEESARLSGMLKTAAKAMAVYSAVRVAIWLVAP